MKGKAALVTDVSEVDIDIKHLMEWAEIDGGRHLSAEDEGGEPCEADIQEDLVGLPAGTAESEEELEEEMEEVAE